MEEGRWGTWPTLLWCFQMCSFLLHESMSLRFSGVGLQEATRPLAWPSQVRLSGDNPAASPSPSPSHLQKTRSQAIGRKNYQPGFSLILTYPAIILVLCKNTTCFSCGVLRACYSNLNFSHLGTTSAFFASSAYHLYYNQYSSLNQFPIFTCLKSRHITIINAKPVSLAIKRK